MTNDFMCERLVFAFKIENCILSMFAELDRTNMPMSIFPFLDQSHNR